MQINLTPDYRIISDGAYNFVLQNKAVRGKNSKCPGEIYWLPVGYFPTLEACLNRALDDYQIRSETVGLKALRDELKAFTKMIKSALKSFEKELQNRIERGLDIVTEEEV